MKSINLKLSIPPSVNVAYAGNGRIRYKSKEYKKWEQIAGLEIKSQDKGIITGDNWLSVDYIFFMPLFYKNGKKKVQDVSNYEKCLTDFLCKEIKGFEDHKIKEIRLRKEDSSNNKVLIKIFELNN